MVLEGIFRLRDLIEHPLYIFILSIIGTSVAITISVFMNRGGLFMVFLIVLALLPNTIKRLRYEEGRKECNHFWQYLYSLGFFERHRELIMEYFLVILGITLTISTAYIILPASTSSIILSDQIDTISQITGQVTSGEIFERILINNLGVMLICFVFSLFYSSGAILLLAWNASVLGVVVGEGARELMGLPAIPIVLLSYIPHGSFEFAGYILAGIAGGLLSVALSRHRESKEHFRFVFEDSLTLLVLGIVVLIIGAFIEVSAIM